MKAPFVQAKDHDHEDVDLEFRADETMNAVLNFVLSLCACVLLLAAIYVLANVNMVVGA